VEILYIFRNIVCKRTITHQQSIKSPRNPLNANPSPSSSSPDDPCCAQPPAHHAMAGTPPVCARHHGRAAYAPSPSPARRNRHDPLTRATAAVSPRARQRASASSRDRPARLRSWRADRHISEKRTPKNVGRWLKCCNIF
jgi:hypothetical protein